MTRWNRGKAGGEAGAQTLPIGNQHMPVGATVAWIGTREVTGVVLEVRPLDKLFVKFSDGRTIECRRQWLQLAAKPSNVLVAAA